MLSRPVAGPFRGLAPYLEGDGDLLFGRDQERAALVDRARSPEGATLLLTGEVGSGKTSLLRAGLIPRVSSGGRLSVYIDCCPGWEEELRKTLARLLGRPLRLDEGTAALCASLPGSSGGAPSGTLFVLDHLEVLLWMPGPEVDAFRRFVGALPEAVKTQPGRLVLACDRGNLHALSLLGETLPSVHARNTVTLGRWDRSQAGRVMEQMVLGGYGYMEDGLPQLIADDLCASGPVLPAALQVVGHAAVLHRVTKKRAYERAGGALALAAFYVEHLAERAGGWRARRVLACFSDQSNPNLPLSVEEIARGAGLAEAQAGTLLPRLEEEGLLRRYAGVPNGAPGAEPDVRYGVLHHYLRQPIRDFVAPVNRGRARARLALRRRFARWGVLWPMELVGVFRHLGKTLAVEEELLVRRSMRLWMLAAAVAVTLPAFILLGLWLGLSRSAYLDALEEVPRTPHVVLRSGDPSRPVAAALVPGTFDEVELDTGLTLRSLSATTAQAIALHRLVGSLRRPSVPIPPWLRLLLDGVPLTRQAAFLVLAGERSAGAQLLQAAASDPQQRRRAIEVAALLLRATELQAVLAQGLSDASPQVRLLSVATARLLSGDAMLPLVRQALKDGDASVRRAALHALDGAGPAVGMPLYGSALRDADPRVQHEAMTRVAAIARSHPTLALDLVLDLGEPKTVRLGELHRLLARLLAATPKPLAEHIVARLGTASTPSRRVQLLEWLSSVAHRVPATLVRPVLARLGNDASLVVRSAALSLEARYEDPRTMMPRLAQLAKATQPEARRAAAAGLGLMKAPLDKDRWDLLKALLKDRTPAVRGAAVHSMLRIGNLGLGEVARAMKAGPPDVAEAAMREVCDEPSLGANAATTLLGVAWRMKRLSYRQQALACAQSLASGSPRLYMWLSDQAARDKEPFVRRAGAAAAAAALRLGGPSLGRLARLYLGDKDRDVRVAMLHEIVDHPVKSPGFLFPMVEARLKDPESEVRASAAPAVVLTARPDQVVRALGRLLQDPDAGVRRAAIRAAYHVSPQAGLGPLDERLAAVVENAPTEDALAAIRAAGKLRLLTTLKRATVRREAAVRAAAVEALAPTADPRAALPLLKAALNESEGALRLVALRAIAAMAARLGRPAAELLGEATFAADPSERRAAFQALGKVQGRGAPAARNILLEATRHPSEERRQVAWSALGPLAAEDQRIAAALAAAARDPALDVRREAQSALVAHWGRTRPLEELWRALEGSARSGLDRRLAISALAWHGRLHGVAPLERRAKGLGSEALAVTRIAANLALALARAGEPPRPLVDWLYGW
jgi:HEAT repeat protein/energy-coupling factor transporter ATP-binding protein EcfA2